VRSPPRKSVCSKPREKRVAESATAFLSERAGKAKSAQMKATLSRVKTSGPVVGEEELD
jgi:hypothetical protein